jgi:2,4-dienoyl-CoA reductase-like NADH-dependent reductase (Old Yellow Enzyme family)
MRFVREVLRAIRSAVGDEFVVGIRLGASEMPGSIQEGELRQVIEALQDEGPIDYLMTTWGDYYRMFTVGAGMDLGAGYELPSAGQLTSAASVPSIVTGRFRTLEEVEQVLLSGAADMVSMVRAHIAEPDIVLKTREGRAHEIRPCIACN